MADINTEQKEAIELATLMLVASADKSIANLMTMVDTLVARLMETVVDKDIENFKKMVKIHTNHLNEYADVMEKIAKAKAYLKEQVNEHVADTQH